MAQYFCSIFPRRDSFIWKAYDQARWQKAKGPLLDGQILGVVSDEWRGLFRGTYWSHKTRQAVFDIDSGSSYHQAAELAGLQEKLAAVGLRAKPYQSSDSGGWHLYLPFDDWEESSEVETLLKAWLRSEKYRIESGQLEVFPSGNALRLPLQKGFGWLGSEGNLLRIREEMRMDEALASFLCDLEENKKNWSEAKSRIESQLHSAGGATGAGVQAHRKAIDTEGFDGLWNSGRIDERIEEARHYLDCGLTGNGQRHAAIYAIEHLLWFGDPARGVPKLSGTQNDERRQRYLRQWLERNHNGYCDHIRRGNWRELDEHIRRACEWRRHDHQPVAEFVPYMVTERAADAMIGLTKKTGYLWTADDLERANQKREVEARERIRAAVQLLRDQGRKVSIRPLMRLARCCNKTIKRHSDIYQISPGVALSSVGGDLDPGGMGGGAALGCSDSSELQDPNFEIQEIQKVVLPGTAGESFLSSPCSGDSRQGDLSCVFALEVLVPADSQGSSEAPPSPPLAAAESSLVADSALCLLSCADRLVAKAREGDGMESPETLASPSRTQPSTGSKHWLGGSLGTCGLNGFLPSYAEPPLGPLHLNPREIFSKGSGSVTLQDDGESRQAGQGPVGEAGKDRGGQVCYTNATDSGITEQAGATSRVGAQSSFRAEHKNGERIPDVTNSKFLATIKPAYSSGFTDEFSLIYNAPPDLSHTKTSANVLDFQAAPVLSASGRLFVISQTYRLGDKQTSGADVVDERPLGEPLGETLHQSCDGLISGCIQCWAMLSGFGLIPQVPDMEACPVCRRLADKHSRTLPGTHVRGPPNVYSP